MGIDMSLQGFVAFHVVVSIIDSPVYYRISMRHPKSKKKTTARQCYTATHSH